MLKSTLDDLIVQESSGLCQLVESIVANTPSPLSELHINAYSVKTRLEQLIKERKNAR